MSNHKAAIFAPNPTFLPPILDELKSRNVEVACMNFTGDNTADLLSTVDLLEWADCAFFDFCFDPLPFVSKRLNNNCRITARLHGLEVYDSAMRKTEWKNIHLVASPPQVKRYKAIGLPEPKSLTCVNIGVTVPPIEPKEVFGHNIAVCAVSPLPRKRLYTTIETFLTLLKYTKEHDNMKDVHWNLHVRGINPNSYRQNEAVEYVNFIKELIMTADEQGLDASKHVFFHDPLDEQSWRRFLSGMDIIVSNSMQEGYHKTVFEAMSYGVFPLVHRWYGADTLFNEQSLFMTQDELWRKIIGWHQLSIGEKQAIALKQQKIVRKEHDEKVCAKKVVDIILGEETQ